MHPFVVNMFRFMASFLAIAVVYAFQKEARITWAVFKTNLRSILLLGFLGYFLYQLVFILGINSTTAGNSALIMASTPVWTALTARAFTQERLRPLEWMGLLLCIAGAIYISTMGGKSISMDNEFFLGNVIILFAAICWGSYTTFSRPAMGFINAKELTLIGLIVSFPLNVALALPYLGDVIWPELTAYTWLAIIYSGTLSTGIAVVLWIVSVKKLGATRTAVFGNMVPLIAVIASFFMLGEQIVAEQLLGGSLIIGGLILMRLNR